MIPQNFEYATPASMKEALALLSGGDAKILAGGMSLIPMMKLRLAAPERLVDLSRVPGLTGITEDKGSIRMRLPSSVTGLISMVIGWIKPETRGKDPSICTLGARRARNCNHSKGRWHCPMRHEPCELGKSRISLEPPIGSFKKAQRGAGSSTGGRS